ncbi:hypothetical protein [Burkholderia sp. THE68]|uniref:hypothetical protein n=1 Tax=Burkholderia sp. THE68 TaxID=758782 RepID=UPI00138A2258|nr:hypothetical protein [Burkholderia sp. THE68]
MSENDSPYSSGYETYAIHGFKGDDVTFTPSANWDQVFQKMRPSCLKCGATLTPANLCD